MGVQFPSQEDSPGGGNSNLLQYSCLENPMDRRAWQATVHGSCKDTTQQLDNNNMTMGQENEEKCQNFLSTVLKRGWKVHEREIFFIFNYFCCTPWPVGSQSPSWDLNCTACSGNMVSEPLNHQGSPWRGRFLEWVSMQALGTYQMTVASTLNCVPKRHVETLTPSTCGCDVGALCGNKVFADVIKSK